MQGQEGKQVLCWHAGRKAMRRGVLWFFVGLVFAANVWATCPDHEDLLWVRVAICFVLICLNPASCLLLGWLHGRYLRPVLLAPMVLLVLSVTLGPAIWANALYGWGMSVRVFCSALGGWPLLFAAGDVVLYAVGMGFGRWRRAHTRRPGCG